MPKPNEALQEKIGQIANLPTLPQIASRLMHIVNDPESSARDVAALVGQDMSLAAKILRLANSAFYGMPRSITSVTNAVVILGMKVITTMVLSVTVFDMFPGDKRSSLFDRKAFWRHGLGCGLIAKLLTGTMQRAAPFDPEEAFCAGLLHDIGKIVMEQYLHQDFHTALQYASDYEMSSYQAEEKALGYTHCDVAYWLTKEWDLPQELQLPLVYHHAPAEAEECRDIVGLCHYADRLCYDAELAADKSYRPPPVDAKTVAGLKIAPVDVKTLTAVLPEEMAKMAVFFEIAGK